MWNHLVSFSADTNVVALAVFYYSYPWKIWNASRICVSSLRRGHANLLCIVPILVYVPPKRVQGQEAGARAYVPAAGAGYERPCLSLSGSAAPRNPLKIVSRAPVHGRCTTASPVADGRRRASELGRSRSVVKRGVGRSRRYCNTGSTRGKGGASPWLFAEFQKSV